MIQNEVLNAIHARRSIRSFTDRKIEPEQLDALFDAAIWAPSGGNNQSWLFTAIQNKQTLLSLNELVREGFHHCVPDDDYPHAKRHWQELVEITRTHYQEVPLVSLGTQPFS